MGKVICFRCMSRSQNRKKTHFGDIEPTGWAGLTLRQTVLAVSVVNDTVKQVADMWTAKPMSSPVLSWNIIKRFAVLKAESSHDLIQTW